MANQNGRTRFVDAFLNGVEKLGNKLPDPAVLFVVALAATWLVSWLLAGTTFEIPGASGPRVETVQNQLTGPSLAGFLAGMVETFMRFQPLGVVLVALLGVGVAERSGFINACLKALLGFTPRKLLTPMLILVALLSHTATDAGYVLVIPLGAVIFYAAGRHPLSGIAAAFAGVSGGFSANLVVSGIDPLLSGLTQIGANVIDPAVQVNPLCNFYFTASSSVLIIAVGWFITDRIIEPRLARTPVDGAPEDMPKMEPMTRDERRGMRAGLVAALIGLVGLAAIAYPERSPLRPQPTLAITMKDGTVYTGAELPLPAAIRFVAVAAAPADARAVPVKALLLARPDALEAALVDAAEVAIRPGVTGTETPDQLLLYQDATLRRPALVARAGIAEMEQRNGALTEHNAPLMKSVVPLIFLLFLLPGIVHGYVSRTFKSHRDIVQGMAKSMETMGYYLVMAFCAALFIKAFTDSNLGGLLAVRGAEFLQASGMPGWATLVGIVLLCALVNLLIGSSSAKWAMLAPIFVPMLMALEYSPALTQAAYRVGDSSTNIITPLMPYFPLVVAFSQRYVKGTGIGTLTSLMLPYSIAFLVLWTGYLLLWFAFGIPLGIGGGHEYLPPAAH